MAAVVALLSIKILVQKGAEFPDGHIGKSKAMGERGITCATSMDRMEYNKKSPRFDFTKATKEVQDSI